LEKTPYNPTVLLRCVKCLDKTPHVLVNFSNDPASTLTLLYECQECGEIKKVFDLDTLPQVTFEPAKNIAVAVEEKTRLIPIERGPQIEQSEQQ
jgi:uncharacterized Zn finger protein